MSFDWIDFAKNFGVPFLLIVLLFLAIGLFVWKLLWPYILTQQEQANKAKEQERLDRIAITDKFVQATDKFVESMTARDQMMKESLAERDKILLQSSNAQNLALDESTKNVVASLNILTTEIRKKREVK